MQRKRSAKSGLMIASALACAGCLVTSELEFEANRNLPTAKPVSPPLLSVVPSNSGSDECDFGTNRLAFNADYYDQDVDQQLYVLPKVNGITLFQSAVPIAPDPAGSAKHVATPICVPIEKLREPCNLVELFVTDQLDLFNVTDVEPLKYDPRVDYLEWRLLPPAKDSPGAAGKPYVGVSACEPDSGDM
ncbi:MAG TPA: hypothetical protein VI299_30295 [Polyangiales bacterium]